MREITSTAEFTKLLNENNYVVVDFWAPWCGPCVNFAPTFQQFADSHKDVVFVKVNVDNNQELSTQYSVSSIPYIVGFSKGKKIGDVVGANKGAVETLIQKVKSQ